MFQPFNYIILFLCTINHSFSYTVIYKKSENYCNGNTYTHIYDYLEENSHCFRIQWCSKDHCCEQECGIYSFRAEQVRILDTELIPRHAFKESPNLRYITGIQKNITTLASNSFVDLPNLEEINLSFNLIRYIHHDVFKNVSAKFLNLSYNKIIYIEQDAFSELSNLEVLNLKYNELSYIYSLPKDSVLKNFILAHNFLQRLVISSVRYPRLEILDASFNNLTNIAVTSNSAMKLINLYNNDLQVLDVFETQKVEELNIGMNQFNDLTIVETDNVEKISLFPNPWFCSKLDGILTTYTLVNKEHSNYPRCVIESSSENEYRLDYSSEEPVICFEDQMCNDNNICRNNRYIDPCLDNICDSTSVCVVKNHQFTCNCPDGQKRNPVEYNSPCYKVECFVDKDCPSKIPCNKVTNKCDDQISISFGKASSVVMSYPWFYDKIDAVLGKVSYIQNFHRTESTHYRVTV